MNPSGEELFNKEQSDLLQDLFEIPQRSCDRKVCGSDVNCKPTLSSLLALTMHKYTYTSCQFGFVLTQLAGGTREGQRGFLSRSASPCIPETQHLPARYAAGAGPIQRTASIDLASSSLLVSAVTAVAAC